MFTTDPEEGYLNRLAIREGTRTLPIPSDVGGPFSVLTPVGLFPAAVSDIDVEALLCGADEVEQEVTGHQAVRGAAYHYLRTPRGDTTCE